MIFPSKVKWNALKGEFDRDWRSVSAVWYDVLLGGFEGFSYRRANRFEDKEDRNDEKQQSSEAFYASKLD